MSLGLVVTNFDDGAVGDPYPIAQFSADPAKPGVGGPYTFAVTAGALPAGLTLSTDGKHQRHADIQHLK